MKILDLDDDDRELVAAAEDVLARNERPERHGVGAAVRCASGRIYAGVNIEACCYGPCAEPIALGAAISAGERDFVGIVAIHRVGDGFDVIAPCGNCRQMLVDYAPGAWVILDVGGVLGKALVRDLLPYAFKSFDD